MGPSDEQHPAVLKNCLTYITGRHVGVCSSCDEHRGVVLPPPEQTGQLENCNITINPVTMVLQVIEQDIAMALPGNPEYPWEFYRI